ncbi:MAG: GAF domain-containing protein [Candidatus Izemoplasmatales bacterium]|nr:GAF domain-containing protein [Candidatus Izemoplasmatales bacterium]
MFKLDLSSLDDLEKEKLFFETLSGYLEKGLPLISNLANFTAVIAYFDKSLNWVGFYLEKDGSLWLGPFQGKPACTRIENGRGVCGKAMATKATVLVYDTHKFPGHIACDAQSRSELVIPVIKEGRFLGVLDLDAPIVGSFDESKRQRYEKAVRILIDFI